MCPQDLDDDLEPEERRRIPDLFRYRLGSVEELAKRNTQEINKLERMVYELVAGMPARFPSRIEHDKLAEQMSSLTSHLETYVATANASNAIRESNDSKNRTVRLQWPAWVFMAVNTALVILTLLLHH